MEASTLQPPASLAQAQPRIALASPLLRLRSDEQLVALFRAGYDEAFRVIHDRYNKRLFAYARQMLPARQDAEDALQDVFVRAYSGLRASDRDLALRAWLFRVAHNRCVDELRKPTPPPPEVLQLVRTNAHDPLAEVDLRESLRRLVEDIRRLPEQQRSALLMRELAGMSYAELASSLGVSVGAVKSLLVRARLGLAQAAAARDTACTLIREQLVEAHDRGVRPNANTRKHVRDCSSCKSFRHDLRGVSRQLAATTPAIGPLGFLAKLLGISGGGGAAGGAGGGVALLGGGGTTASAGGLALSTGHVATLIVAAVATAGGAVEIQHTILPAAKHAASAPAHHGTGQHGTPAVPSSSSAAIQTGAYAAPANAARNEDVSLPNLSAPGPATATRPASASDTTNSGAAAGSAGAKRHARSQSTTTTKTATTTGSSTSGTCAAAGGSDSTVTTGSAGSASTTGSTSSSAPASTTTSSSSSPTTTSSCGSTSTSPTGTTAPSSTSPTTGSDPSAGTATSTSAGSSSSAAAAPSTGTGSTSSSSTASSTSASGR